MWCGHCRGARNNTAVFSRSRMDQNLDGAHRGSSAPLGISGGFSCPRGLSMGPLRSPVSSLDPLAAREKVDAPTFRRTGHETPGGHFACSLWSEQ